MNSSSQASTLLGYPEIVEDVNAKAAALGGEATDMVASLRKALSEQMKILTGSLEVHGRVCSESVLPLHEHLMGRFVELRKMMAGLGVAC